MSNTSLIRFSDSEDTFLADLLRDRKQDPSIAVPDDMEPHAVIAAVDRCVSVLVKLGRGEGYIVPILGRLMARVAKDRLYEVAGFDTIKDFEIARIEEKGVAHSTLWQAKRVYEIFPDLPLERYAAIGPKKLQIAASVCNDKTSNKQKRELLEKAEESPSVERFRKHVEEESGLSEHGGTTGATFDLIGNLAQVIEFKEWLANDRFIEFAKSNHPLTMVLAAIAEASSVFPHDHEKWEW